MTTYPMKPPGSNAAPANRPVQRWGRLPVLIALLLIAQSADAVFRCVDEQGVVTFRDTPCPILPDRSEREQAPSRTDTVRDRAALTDETQPLDWLDIARMASRIRLDTDIDQVEALLGTPIEQQRAGIRAHYVFELPIYPNTTYQAEIYTVNNRVTAIKDTFRHHWAPGLVAPGMDYDEIMMTWGPPDDELHRRTTQGIETVLIYTTEDRDGQGDRIVMLDDVVISVQYDVRLDS